MPDTPAAQAIAPIVVEKRLELVAKRLTEVAAESIADDDDRLEDELLMDPTGTDENATPSNTIDLAQPTTTTTTTTNDSVGERVALIFGKRSASIDPVNPSKVKSPKTIANGVIPGSAEDDFEAVPEIAPKESSEKSSTESEDAPVPPVAPVVPSPPIAPAPPVVQNVPENPVQEPAAMEVDEEWEPGQIEPNDRPEGFPDVGFPDEPPSYPEQPDFYYRYRVDGSTPRARRLDFERSIRLRACPKDQYTGRISDSDYRQREEEEMKVALGYVYFTIQDRIFYFSGPYTLLIPFTIDFYGTILNETCFFGKFSKLPEAYLIS